MAGERKRKERAALVTKALLLGYNIELEGIGIVGATWYNLQGPDGKWLLKDGLPVAFEARWRAAQKALELSGVPYDAKKSSGDLGVGSGARYRLRGRQRLRGSAKRVPESSGA